MTTSKYSGRRTAIPARVFTVGNGTSATATAWWYLEIQTRAQSQVGSKSGCWMVPPNTRVQRTRSSPSALRSPLTRRPLGAI